MWNRAVIAIPSMPARAALLERLLVRLRTECRGAMLTWRVHRDGDPARVDFPAIIAASLDTEQRWIMHMEDDAWPAPVFGDVVPRALQHAELVAASAITFFSRHKADVAAVRADLASGRLEPRYRRVAPASLCMIQCVALRRETMVGFPEWAPSWYEAHPEHNHAADLLLGAWLSRQRARVLAHVPSLVQHLDVPSTLPNHRGVRQSETYRLAFGEAP